MSEPLDPMLPRDDGPNGREPMLPNAVGLLQWQHEPSRLIERSHSMLLRGMGIPSHMFIRLADDPAPPEEPNEP